MIAVAGNPRSSPSHPRKRVSLWRIEHLPLTLVASNVIISYLNRSTSIGKSQYPSVRIDRPLKPFIWLLYPEKTLL